MRRLCLSFCALLVLLGPAAPSSARRAPRARRARVELDVSVWERGVGMVHVRESSLTFALELRRGHASLHVTGRFRARSTSLPPGPHPPSRHEAEIDERFSGPVSRDGRFDVIALTREGGGAIAPRTIEWRCERAPADLASHAGALRCVGTAPLDPLPWHNGHWSQVPIALAYDEPATAIHWDGEGTPAVTLR